MESFLIDHDRFSVELCAGTSVELRLPFESQSDSPVEYRGRVEGSGAAHAVLVRELVPLRPHEHGEVVARFSPPVAGVYELTMSVEDDGYLVPSTERRTVTMVVGERSDAPTGPVRTETALYLNLVGGDAVPLVARTSIPPGPIPGLAPKEPGGACARVVERPDRPGVLGLSNDSTAEWSVLDVDETAHRVTPGRMVPLRVGVRIKFGQSARGRIEAAPVALAPRPALFLNLPGGAIALEAGASIRAGEIADLTPSAAGRPAARVVERADRPGSLGLRNDSTAEWSVRTGSGDERRLAPGRTMPLKGGERIGFGGAGHGQVDAVMLPLPPDPPKAGGETPPPPKPKRGDDKPFPTDGYPRVVRNPEPGAELSLDPGETVLVVLDFENNGSGNAVYVLRVKDHNHPDVDFAEAEVLRSLVDLGETCKGQLAFKVWAAKEARPGLRSMRVLVGQEAAGRELESFRLGLRVNPRVLVGLAAEVPRVVVGPLNRTPELALKVTNEGNAETAYRLRAKAATVVSPGAESPDVTDEGGWWYLFDKEAENVEKDRPVAARLRLFRPGTWWWGCWQTARLRAVAVPVTDPRNAGFAGNAVDLAATRWRFLPAPWYVALPALLLFFSVALGMVGVGDPEVWNAIHAQDDKLLFVLPDKPDGMLIPEDVGSGRKRPLQMIKAELRWSAPLLSLQKVESNIPGAEIRSGYHNAQATRTPRSYNSSPETFRITSLLGSGDSKSKPVVFVPMMTTNQVVFDFRVDAGGKETKINMVSHVAKETVDAGSWPVRTITIRAGLSKKFYVYVKNASKGTKLFVWSRQLPRGCTMWSGSALGQAASINESPNSGDLNHLRFAFERQDVSRDPDDLWLVTTDSANALVHIVVQRTGGNP